MSRDRCALNDAQPIEIWVLLRLVGILQLKPQQQGYRINFRRLKTQWLKAGLKTSLVRPQLPFPTNLKRSGKSGGYRIIYYLRTSISIILVTIYSKTEQADISAAQIRRIVGEFQKSE